MALHLRCLPTEVDDDQLALLRQGVAKKDTPKSLFDKSWVVYAKRPFGGVESVIEYLGRYTHRIDISNSRIKRKVKSQKSKVKSRKWKVGKIDNNTY
jgi:hypothetical protein